MKFLHAGILSVFLSILLVLLSAAYAAGSVSFAQPFADHQKAAPASPESSSFHTRYTTLFPGLDTSLIASLVVVTPDQRFEFCCRTPQNVSVNGNQADEEIFSTLVEQIDSLPVSRHDVFAPSGAPAMTIVISTLDGTQHIACFYSSVSGNPARIISGEPDAPLCYLTDAWRIGTLMMTCEGTRIQDALGNESPAQLMP